MVETRGRLQVGQLDHMPRWLTRLPLSVAHNAIPLRYMLLLATPCFCLLLPLATLCYSLSPLAVTPCFFWLLAVTPCYPLRILATPCFSLQPRCCSCLRLPGGHRRTRGSVALLLRQRQRRRWPRAAAAAVAAAVVAAAGRQRRWMPRSVHPAETVPLALIVPRAKTVPLARRGAPAGRGAGMERRGTAIAGTAAAGGVRGRRAKAQGRAARVLRQGGLLLRSLGLGAAGAGGAPREGPRGAGGRRGQGRGAGSTGGSAARRQRLTPGRWVVLARRVPGRALAAGVPRWRLQGGRHLKRWRRW